MKKKIMTSFIVIIMFFTCSMPTVVRAADGDDGSWVGNAFQAAYDFLNGTNGDLEIEENSIAYKLLTFFTNIVNGINKILIVLLAGLSIISLSIVGVRYILSGAMPKQREDAKHQLHTVFLGMAYGFGAFMIWNIAMSIIRIVLTAMAQG